MAGYRKLRCSRTNYVRCASRFLVSGHLLGTELQAFELLLYEVVQKLEVDYEVNNCRLIDFEYGRLPKGYAYDVCFLRKHCRCSRTNYKQLLPESFSSKTCSCASRFLVSSHLLGTELQVFELLLYEVVQKLEVDYEVNDCGLIDAFELLL